MAIVDQSAMYRAGLARGSTGRNPKVERQIRRRERLVDFAYEVVGTVATEAIKDGFEGMQKFRDSKESQTAAMNLAVDKVPRENVTLHADIRKIHANFKEAARGSRLTLGKKRAEHKANMNKYMTQMKDMNSFLEAYKFHTPQSQGMMSVASGIAGENNQGGNANISPASIGPEVRNLAEQANGDMGMLLNWDHEEGTMRVQRGGKWIEDGSGRRSYVSLGIGENKELKKKYDDYVKRMKSVTQDPDQQQGATVSAGGTGDFSLGGNMPTHADAFGEQKTQEMTGAETMSYQDWAQTQDRGSLRNAKYSALKFAKKEDKTMANDYLDELKNNTVAGYKKDSTPWDLIAGDNRRTFNAKVDSYNDSTFKDFFFGGEGFDHSSRRMPESSLAYRLLISRNNDDNPDNDLVPPGSLNSTEESNVKWQGALTTLKMQSMVPGSVYRKYAKETLWGELEERYTNAQDRWAKDHAKTLNINKSNERGYNTIDLPWQENIREARNKDEVIQQDLVEDVLSGRDRVRSGGDIYTRQPDGRYRLTGEISGNKESSVDSDITRTRTELITVGGGRFGNIPTDFKFDDEGSQTTTTGPNFKDESKKIINIGEKSMPMSDVSKDTYTFIDGKPYTKKRFFMAVQSKRLSQKQVEEGGKIAQQLQNKRG